MHKIVLAVLVVAAVPAAAAEKEQWAPAPVPSVGPGTAVAPADRAGVSDGSAHDAPFSAIGVGSITAGGATSPNQTNTTGSPNPSSR